MRQRSEDRGTFFVVVAVLFFDVERLVLNSGIIVSYFYYRRLVLYCSVDGTFIEMLQQGRGA